MVPGAEFDAHLRQVQVKKLPLFSQFIGLSQQTKAQSLSTTLSTVVQGLLEPFLNQIWTLLKGWVAEREQWSVDRGCSGITSLIVLFLPN